MPLTISTRMEDNFAIIELAGSLTLGPSLKGLRESARKLLSTTKVSGIILRFGEVTSTDSSGLGELTVVYTFASKQGCPIRLVEVSPTLRQMLKVTHLDGLLPSAADLVTAKKELKNR